MNTELFKGNLVNLVPLDVDKEMSLWENWYRDSEYARQLDIGPAAQFCASLTKEYFEAHSDSGALFMIHTTAEDKTIGFIEVDGFNWSSRSGWVAIGIGEADYRGKGYGTEAMQLLLRYAFRGLNLNRVNLNVFAFNQRAIKSYEKCGFKYEGTQREVIFKEDQRWDVVDMGILKSEWEALYSD